MDDAEQRAGEARVKEVFIQKMTALGFMKPAGMKVDQFEAMQREICQKLAYMSEVGLGALVEVMQDMGGGKAGDRFPVAPKILAEARKIEAPEAGASPLVRKVFASGAGARALEEGFAPELLVWLKANRRWPGDFILSTVRQEARDNVVRFGELERDVANGRDLSPEMEGWRLRRRAAIARCEEARILGQGDAA